MIFIILQSRYPKEHWDTVCVMYVSSQGLVALFFLKILLFMGFFRFRIVGYYEKDEISRYQINI